MQHSNETGRPLVVVRSKVARPPKPLTDPFAVSSELVRAHGGDVRVEDARGGTTVVVTLPLVPPPDADPLGTFEQALVAGTPASAGASP